MFLTGQTLSRRAALKGLGATVALPFLEAMVPSVRLRARGASAIDTRTPTRLVCIEMVHGAAGSSIYGAQQNLWSPATTGRDFDLTGTSLKALEPFRVEGPVQDPAPLPYLATTGPQAYDIHLEAALAPAGKAPTTISRTNFRTMYWSIAQQLAHHTVSGCNTRVGDLMGSGTISGPEPDSFGSLLELTWNGQKPLSLTGGGERSFLEDGDDVVITGWCQGDGYRVGFGSVTGRVTPSQQSYPGKRSLP